MRPEQLLRGLRLLFARSRLAASGFTVVAFVVLQWLEEPYGNTLMNSMDLGALMWLIVLILALVMVPPPRSTTGVSVP